MKAELLKRLKRLEKLAGDKHENYECDLSDWSVPELKSLEAWMVAGSQGSLPEEIKDKTVRYKSASKSIEVPLKKVAYTTVEL